MQLKLPSNQQLQVKQLAPGQAVPILGDHIDKIASVINSQVSVGYVPIPVAPTIQVGHSIQFIEDMGTISTIEVARGFIGPLYLIAVDGFDYDAAGNISINGGVLAGTGRLFIWEGRSWYPIV